MIPESVCLVMRQAFISWSKNKQFSAANVSSVLAVVIASLSTVWLSLAVEITDGFGKTGRLENQFEIPKRVVKK